MDAHVHHKIKTHTHVLVYAAMCVCVCKKAPMESAKQSIKNAKKKNRSRTQVEAPHTTNKKKMRGRKPIHQIDENRVKCDSA
jgi:hypothetical protein